MDHDLRAFRGRYREERCFETVQRDVPKGRQEQTRQDPKDSHCVANCTRAVQHDADKEFEKGREEDLRQDSQTPQVTSNRLNSTSLLSRISDFVQYMKLNERDPLMVLKFLKQLPTSILGIYQKELKGLDKKEQGIQFMMLEDITSSIVSHSSDSSNEPEYFKKYVNAGLPLRESKSQDSQVLTHDIIGKPLGAFYRECEDGSKLPKVFQAINSYFMEDRSRLMNSHLFAKLDDAQMKQVDLLE